MYIFKNDKSYLVCGAKFGSRIIRDINPDCDNLLGAFEQEIDSKTIIEVYNRVLSDGQLPIFIAFRSPQSWYRSAVMESIVDILIHNEILETVLKACGICYREQIYSYNGYEQYDARFTTFFNSLPDSSKKQILIYIIENFGTSIMNNGHLKSFYYSTILSFLLFTQKHYPESLERIHILDVDNPNLSDDIVQLGAQVKMIDSKFYPLHKHSHSKAYLANIIDPILKTQLKVIGAPTCSYPFPFSLYLDSAVKNYALIREYFDNCLVNVDRYNRLFSPQ